MSLVSLLSKNWKKLSLYAYETPLTTTSSEPTTTPPPPSKITPFTPKLESKLLSTIKYKKWGAGSDGNLHLLSSLLPSIRPLQDLFGCHGIYLVSETPTREALSFLEVMEISIRPDFRSVLSVLSCWAEKEREKKRKRKRGKGEERREVGGGLEMYRILCFLREAVERERGEGSKKERDEKGKGALEMIRECLEEQGIWLPHQREGKSTFMVFFSFFFFFTNNILFYQTTNSQQRVLLNR